LFYRIQMFVVHNPVVKDNTGKAVNKYAAYIPFKKYPSIHYMKLVDDCVELESRQKERIFIGLVNSRTNFIVVMTHYYYKPS